MFEEQISLLGSSDGMEADWIEFLIVVFNQDQGTLISVQQLGGAAQLDEKKKLVNEKKYEVRNLNFLKGKIYGATWDKDFLYIKMKM
jgi:hypothetical protein